MTEKTVTVILNADEWAVDNVLIKAIKNWVKACPPEMKIVAVRINISMEKDLLKEEST